MMIKLTWFVGQDILYFILSHLQLVNGMFLNFLLIENKIIIKKMLLFSSWHHHRSTKESSSSPQQPLLSQSSVLSSAPYKMEMSNIKNR